MNREIKEVVKLLAEIDKICKREGIPYYLGPQLTLCCVTGQEITSLMQVWSICGLRIWSAFVWL
ncbi:hypothetical protein [Ruminococcus sp. AM42-11]|uniref:hypothetical protein n=1 Tax=Ruminococcus sp. AM42-11 TaxID=2292372 RepID=UPI0011C47D10|nr:hypothetical protein [Ruminococcus sp. AM42-11]